MWYRPLSTTPTSDCGPPGRVLGRSVFTSPRAASRGPSARVEASPRSEGEVMARPEHATRGAATLLIEAYPYGQQERERVFPGEGRRRADALGARRGIEAACEERARATPELRKVFPRAPGPVREAQPERHVQDSAAGARDDGTSGGSDLGAMARRVRARVADTRERPRPPGSSEQRRKQPHT